MRIVGRPPGTSAVGHHSCEDLIRQGIADRRASSNTAAPKWISGPPEQFCSSGVSFRVRAAECQ
jgi:hypothetical protein